MKESGALSEYRRSLALGRALLSLGRATAKGTTGINPDIRDGLVGAATVFIVGGFERFIKEAVREDIETYVNTPDSVVFDKLPDVVRKTSVVEGARLAATAPPYVFADEYGSRYDFVLDVSESACSGVVRYEPFVLTGLSPGSDYVKAVFKRLGVTGVFPNAKAQFEAKWGSPVVDGFINAKLTEIVLNRHRAAHGLPLSSVTLEDLKEHLKFMRVLAELIDISLRTRARELAREGRRI